MAAINSDGHQPPAKRIRTGEPQGNDGITTVLGPDAGRVQARQAAPAKDSNSLAASNLHELAALKQVLKQARQNVLTIQTGGQRLLELSAFHEQSPELRDQVKSNKSLCLLLQLQSLIHTLSCGFLAMRRLGCRHRWHRP